MPPLGETRPAWKVLRVLAQLLELPGFAHDSSEQVRAALLPNVEGAGLQLSNVDAFPLPTDLPVAPEGLQRLAELPLYASDMVVRDAPSLQATRDGRDAALAQLPAGLWTLLGLPDSGEGLVRVTQGVANVTLSARRNAGLAEGVVRLAGGLAQLESLGASYAPIAVVNAAGNTGTAQ